MQVSIKTNIKSENGDVVVHFIGNDVAGHAFWFEDEKFSYGNEHPEWLDSLSFVHSHKVTFCENSNMYEVKNNG